MGWVPDPVLPYSLGGSVGSKPAVRWSKRIPFSDSLSATSLSSSLQRDSLSSSSAPSFPWDNSFVLGDRRCWVPDPVFPRSSGGESAGSEPSGWERLRGKPGAAGNLLKGFPSLEGGETGDKGTRRGNLTAGVVLALPKWTGLKWHPRSWHLVGRVSMASLL